MKVKSTLRLLLFLLSGFAWFTGCKREAAPQQEPTAQIIDKPSIKVINGIVSFVNSDEFTQTMKRLHEMDERTLRETVRGLAGFKSLLTTQPTNVASQNNTGLRTAEDEDDSTPPEEEIFYDDSLVMDPTIAALLNRKREIMFDSVIFRVTDKGVFAYALGKESNFESRYSTPEFEEAIAEKFIDEESKAESDIEEILPDIYLAYRQNPDPDAARVASISACDPGGTLGRNLFGQISDCDKRIDRRRRIRSTTYAQNLGFYSSIGFKTRRQTRFLRIWWGANSPELRCEGDGVYESKYPTMITTNYQYNRSWAYDHQFNSSEAQKVLAWHTGEVCILVWCSDNSKCKPCIIKKWAKKYKYKKHKSDHLGKHNNTIYTPKMYHD